MSARTTTEEKPAHAEPTGPTAGEDPMIGIAHASAMRDVYPLVERAEALDAAATQLPDLAGYHMVAAITQDTINYQLELLWRDQVIRHDLELALGKKGVSLTARLGPPTVRLGTAPDRRTVIFVLPMPEGTFTYWEGYGPEATKRTVAIRDWQYAFRVDMDMRQLEKKALSEGRGVPREVRRHLENVTDDIFTIRQLFMAFQSADLAATDPTLTKLGELSELEEMRSNKLRPDELEAMFNKKSQLKDLLTMYFGSLEGTDNPYVLGYSIERKLVPEDAEKALFAPTAASFSTFPDARKGLSTLNFLLMTRKAPLPEGDLAGLFHANWVTSGTYDGVMAVSDAQFRKQYVEGLILPAVRRALGGEAGEAEFKHVTSPEDLRQKLGVDPERYQRSFGDAVTSPGWALYSYRDNMNEDDGHGNRGFGKVVDTGSPVLKLYLEDRRATSFFLRLAPGPDIVLEGLGFTWRTMHYCEYPLNLRTWNGGLDVSLAFSFRARLVAGTKGRLTIDAQFADNKPTTWHDTNPLIKVTDFFASWFGVTQAQVIEGQTKGLAAMQESFVGGVERELRESFEKLGIPLILPAGDVFYFKNARRDAAQNVLLDISYKAET